MEQLTLNLTGKVRHEERNGRRYLVAPLSLIVPGVLNGSGGALYYPPDEIAKSVDQWNGVPIVVYHPTNNGRNVSARSPDVAFKSKIGRVYNAKQDEKGVLRGEGWFDEDRLKSVDSRVYDAITNGRSVELSTGLFTENVPAPPNATYGDKPYTHIARNYRSDHVAILPDQRGACSLQDGCGVLVNAKNGDDGDDEDFASDDQRRAFFGKLKAGKIKGTKRTKTRKETEDETISRHQKEREGVTGKALDDLRSKHQQEYAKLHPVKRGDTESRYSTKDDLSTSRKDDVISDGGKDWKVVASTTAGGKTQVHATSGGESKVFTSSKQSLLERMKAKGRKDMPNPKAIQTEDTPIERKGESESKPAPKPAPASTTITPTKTEIKPTPTGERKWVDVGISEQTERDEERSDRAYLESIGWKRPEPKKGKERTGRADKFMADLYREQYLDEAIRIEADRLLTKHKAEREAGKNLSQDKWEALVKRQKREAVEADIEDTPWGIARRSKLKAAGMLTNSLDWITLNKFDPSQPRDKFGKWVKREGIGVSSQKSPITPVYTPREVTRIPDITVKGRTETLADKTWQGIKDTLKATPKAILTAAWETAKVGGKVLGKSLKFIYDRYGDKESILSFAATSVLFGAGAITMASAAGALPPLAVGGSYIASAGKMLLGAANLPMAAVFGLSVMEARKWATGIASFIGGTRDERHEARKVLTAGFTSNSDGRLAMATLQMVEEFCQAVGCTHKFTLAEVKDALTQVEEGMTLNMATFSPPKVSSAWLTLNENCGISKGGFQKGNTCAKGGSSNDTGANPESGGVSRRHTTHGFISFDSLKENAKGAKQELKDVAQGIFSRMTLGVGPLVAKGVAAGVRIAPKGFNLLWKGMKALMASMPKKGKNVPNDPGMNPMGGQGTLGDSPNDPGMNPMGGTGEKPRYAKRKALAQVGTVRNAEHIKPDKRSQARAKMYFDQLIELLNSDPNEQQKLILACKEAMKAMGGPTTNTLQWVTLNAKKGDDEESESKGGEHVFETEDQRKAFFGKLRAGEIKGTKSTKPVVKQEAKGKESSEKRGAGYDAATEGKILVRGQFLSTPQGVAQFKALAPHYGVPEDFYVMGKHGQDAGVVSINPKYDDGGEIEKAKDAERDAYKKYGSDYKGERRKHFERATEAAVAKAVERARKSRGNTQESATPLPTQESRKLPGKDETPRLLGEVESVTYPTYKHLREASRVKAGKPTETETRVIDKLKIPDDGLPLGFVSRALIFSEKFRHLKKSEHSALIKAVKSGRLHVREEYRDGKNNYFLYRGSTN